MLKTFSLVRKGDFFILRKRTFPLLKVVIDLEKHLPEIKEIKFLDYCSPEEMAEAIRDIGTFLEAFNEDC